MSTSITLSESNLALVTLKNIHHVHTLELNVKGTILKQKLHTAVLYAAQGNENNENTEKYGMSASHLLHLC